MHRLLTWALCLIVCTGCLSAPFTPGNIVVTRAGDKVNSISNPDGTAKESPIFIDEYTMSGTLVQSISLPCMTDWSPDGGIMEGGAQLNEAGTILTVPCYTGVKNFSIYTFDAASQTTLTIIKWGQNIYTIYTGAVDGSDLYLGGDKTAFISTTVGSKSYAVIPLGGSTDVIGDVQLYKGYAYFLFRGRDQSTLVTSIVMPGGLEATPVMMRNDFNVFNVKFTIHSDTVMYITHRNATIDLTKMSGILRRYTKTGNTWAQSAEMIVSTQSGIGIVNGIFTRIENGQVVVYFNTIKGIYKVIDLQTSSINVASAIQTVVTNTQLTTAAFLDISMVPNSCNNGVKDATETDVDCGGVCAKCADNKGCSVNADCQRSNCNPDTKRCGTCSDGVKNQDESDIDCGGTHCAGCAFRRKCVVNSDCLSGVCSGTTTRICVEQSCNDKIQNQNETDVDCGGVCNTVRKCLEGKKCLYDVDCISFYCNPLQICSTPSCLDTFLNQDETDVDCGGSTCPQCNDTLSCVVDTDCVSNYCNPLQKCSTPSCDDGFKNQDENGIDCGGICGNPCNDGTPCSTNEECSSGFCAPSNNTCVQPTCFDTYQNQDETDVDCGRSCGATCIDGQQCVSLDDCVSNYCSPNNNCSTPSCSDTFLNQNETDTDCGGSCGATCVDGLRCTVNGDCVSDYCNPAGFCSTPTCPDTWLNGNETDLDCGGSCETKCDDGKKCLDNGDCVNDYCAEGLCVMPTCDDNVMNGNETDVDCGGECESCGECLSGSDCLSGVCKDSKCVPRIVSVSIGHVTISAVHALYLNVAVICIVWLAL